MSVVFGTQWITALQKLISGDDKPEPQSVPIDEKEPAHRVRPKFEKKLLDKPEKTNAATLYEIARDSFQNYPNEIAMRKRQFIGMKSPRVKEFSPDLIEYTYEQLGERAHKFGASLKSHGMVASPPTTSLDKNTTPCRMAIFENTCAEWMTAALGAFTQSIVVTTVYATLGIDAVAEAVGDNAIPLIVCNKIHVKTLLDKIKTMPTLKVIVYTDDSVAPDDTSIEMPTPPKGVQVFAFEDFISMGDTEKYPPVPPSPGSTAVVMYTSGSTGKPKGVVITHANVAAAVSGPDYTCDIKHTDSYVAYLPLAHILEMAVEFVVLLNGASLNFADPKTLPDALALFKPSHLVGVPKIYDTIHKGFLGKVKKMSPIQQVIINIALEWRTFALSYGLDTPLFNALVFDKIKDGMGGNLRWALSGGGPLSGETQMFFRVAFGAPLVQAYGLTESTATVAIQADEDMREGVQGAPFPNCEVKLVSTPEFTDKGGMPYLSSDRKDVNGNPCWGRGEILIKGPAVSHGYYMMPDKTKEVYLDGGWFATGDIGQFNEDGTLSIVDRKKNLVKLKSGEYVALEKMEVVYGSSDFVDTLAGGVVVYADGDMDRPVALVELSKKKAMDWAKENGFATTDVAALKDNKDLNKAVLDSLNAEHAKSDLSRIEKLSGVTLLTTPWTVENGCLTAANKIQRRVVISTFSKEFEEVKKKGIFN